MDTEQLRRHNILVVGSSNTDMVIKAGHLPRPGETILGGTFFIETGSLPEEKVQIRRSLLPVWEHL